MIWSGLKKLKTTQKEGKKWSSLSYFSGYTFHVLVGGKIINLFKDLNYGFNKYIIYFKVNDKYFEFM